MSAQKNLAHLLMQVVGITGGLVTLVASFFLAGEDYYPGRFYIQNQGLWDNGNYYVKFTFLLTWLTLLDVVVVPLIAVAGVVALIKRMASPTLSAPAGWDVVHVGRRLKFGLISLVCTPLWLVAMGVIIFSPEWLSPLGGLASVFLMLLPSLPMLIPALALDALIPPRYVVGVLEGLRTTTGRRNQTPTVHFRVGSDSYTTNPSSARGLADGMRVALVASGFFGSVLQLARSDGF
ncbi:MAG TPA: hypothetical protein VGI10_23935 [Polyangiaceae bacterium]